MAAVLVGLSGLPAAAATADPGPPLETPAAQLRGALSCTSTVDDSGTATPVLLVHGTGSNPDESWSWGYRHVLNAQGYPVCEVTLPGRAMGDVQVSTEYVVFAIRDMFRRSGHKIAIVGHSQGGLEPLWALKFWPDLRSKVDDLVALATPYRGTVVGNTFCAVRGGCSAAVWQFSRGSKFVGALNATPPPAGPAYTSVYTSFDELVQPQPDATALPGASHVSVQQICPLRPVEHFYLVADSVGYALVLDAITHPGPADPARISRGTCVQPWIPGMDLAGFTAKLVPAVANPLLTFVGTPVLNAEPPLRCYAIGSCRDQQSVS